MSHRPSTGRLCACGGSKSKQARVCQSCRSLEKRSGLTLQQQRRRWYGFTSPLQVGDSERNQLYLAEALESARAVVDGELAALVVEQQKDDRKRQVSWQVSLDATDRFGRPFYELVSA